jgi:tetratricopeptide (TPR) repeat protein
MARLFLALLLFLPLATPVCAADSTMDLLRFLEMLSPKAEPAPATESAVETQLRYLERDLDRLREEVKTLPEARRLDRLEAEIAGLRAEIKAAEKSAEEAVKEKLEAQDKRIGDLSTSLTMQANQISWHSLSFNAVSTFITLALFCVTIWTAISVPRQAQDAARLKAEELNKEAISEARAQAAEAAEKAAATWIAERGERKLKELDALAQKQRDEHAKQHHEVIEHLNARGEISFVEGEIITKQETTQDKISLTEERNAVDFMLSLPTNQRKAEHWGAISQSLIERKSFEAAVQIIDDWLRQPTLSQADTAFALKRKGKALFNAGRQDEAIRVYDDLISRFEAATDENTLKHVADAFNMRGIARCKRQQPNIEEAVKDFDTVISRFQHNPMFKSMLASAWINRGVALGTGYPKNHEEQILMCNKAISEIGSDISLSVALAVAYLNRGLALNGLSEPRREDAIQDFEFVIANFYATPKCHDLVAQACIQLGNTLGWLDPPRTEEQLLAYDKVDHLFKTEPDLEIWRAIALKNKIKILENFDRIDDLKLTYKQYIVDFENSSKEDIRSIVPYYRSCLDSLETPT